MKLRTIPQDGPETLYQIQRFLYNRWQFLALVDFDRHGVIVKEGKLNNSERFQTNWYFQEHNR